MPSRSLLLALLLSVAAPSAHAADATALAKAFGARAGAWSMRLSPSGDHVSYLAPNGPRGTAIIVADVTSGEAKVTTSVPDGAIKPIWCHWKTETRMVCKFYAVSRANYGEDLGYTRLVAINSDGSKMVIIGQRPNPRSYGVVQFSGDIIDWLPDDSDHVLIAIDVPAASTASTGTIISSSRSGLSVQKVDINTGRTTLYEPPRRGAASFDTDNHGNVRFMGSVDERDGFITDNIDYFYRTKAAKDWIRAGSTNLSGFSDLDFLGFDESGENLLALKKVNGRKALYTLSTDGAGRQGLIFEHPSVDVDGVLRIGKYDRPVAAVYTLDGDAYEFFDTDLRKLSAGLGKALANSAGVFILDENWDGSRKLVYSGTDLDPGHYYLFDGKTRKLGELAAHRPELAGLTLAAVQSVRYKTHDGVEVPGFMTVPPGTPAKNRPAIIMPHGGPGARDQWGFDWLAQYFAQLGYVVLQPNFRGSTGYGENWYAKNGFQSWATAMGDVNDGARWLAAQGIADPGRIAILGWSYGGYAALQANVLDPTLYKAAIAVAPVTDLAALKAHASTFTNAKIVEAMVGSGPHVTAGSPVRNAAAIKVPVLLFHGDRDLNVDIEQSQAMDSALTRAGVKHEFITYKGLDHQLDDSDARADMLKRSADWLAAAMGTP